MQNSFQCQVCGSQVLIGQPFCQNCGQQFQYNCPSCQAFVDARLTACPNCHISLNWPRQQQAISPPMGNNIINKKATNIKGSSIKEIKPERNNFLKGFLGCGGSIILLIIGIAWAIACEMNDNRGMTIIGTFIAFVAICLGIWGIGRFFRR